MNKLAILLGLFAAKEIIFLNLISRIELGSSNLKYKRSNLLWCEQKEISRDISPIMGPNGRRSVS